jgi:hypothetical protein
VTTANWVDPPYNRWGRSVPDDVDPHPPAGAHRDREVLDLSRRADSDLFALDQAGLAALCEHLA